MIFGLKNHHTFHIEWRNNLTLNNSHERILNLWVDRSYEILVHVRKKIINYQEVEVMYNANFQSIVFFCLTGGNGRR